MIDQLKTLQERLDQNYNSYLIQLRTKTADELIILEPEITAAQQLKEELVEACTDEAAAFLLQFDDPLEVMLGYWEAEITGYDHSGEIGHMIWEIQNRELDAKEDSHVEEQRQPHGPTMDAPC